MEAPERRQESGRDINDLLLNGFYKTSRAKSPSAPKTSTSTSTSTSASTNAPAFLRTLDNEASHRRSRSRSRHSARPAPPRPTVEDEIESLAKELSSEAPSDDEPPMRGIIEQYPVILEADVTAAERARLHAEPRHEDDNENRERRFVLIPRPDTYSPNREDGFDNIKGPRGTTKVENGKAPAAKQESGRREEKKPIEKKAEDKHLPLPRPQVERRPSLQDLPALKTNVDKKEIPPPFRRNTPAGTSAPREAGTPKSTRTPSEYHLSPDVHSGRGQKGFFDPTWQPHPRNTNEKLTRPQQLSEEYGSRRTERHASTQSAQSPSWLDRPRSPKSGHRRRSSRHHYSSSEDDLADSSDSDRHHRHHRHDQHESKTLHPGDDHDRHRPSLSRSKSSRDAKPPSRYSSPLPSPKVSPTQLPRGETIPQPRESRKPSPRPVSPLSPTGENPFAPDRLNTLDGASSSRSKPRQPSAVSTKTAQSRGVPQASLPIPIPTRGDHHSSSERYSSSTPHFDESRSPSTRPSATPNTSWQPPPFRPLSNPAALEKPVGSYRRYSEDLERGKVVPLPACPRTTFTRGRNDWLTLPHCPSFDVCPSCFNSTIAPTEFRHNFVAAPRRSSDAEVLCDFGSSPWYRIAWLLTLKEQRRDLNLFYGLARVAATTQPCLGKHEATRQWHSIIDPKTGAPIKNFDVCYGCVKSVETLLPAIRGIFVRTDSHDALSAPRVCDLRFDSKRFIQYFDALETTADTADDMEGPPDTRDLANLAKKLALVEECQRDTDLLDRRWYHITQLPEFTVCEECYDEIVWPEIENHKAIPAMFAKSKQRIPKASCQLYSSKMRSIFQKAVDTNDYKMLASKVRERKTIENAYKFNIAELKHQSQSGKVNPEAVAKETARVVQEWRKWE